MVEAILYHTKCGHTYTYAKALSTELNIPLYTIRSAKKHLPKKSHIIFMSWVKENKIVKYSKVCQYCIECVIAVGILPATEERISIVRTENQISTALYYLPGGIRKSRLGILNRITLKTIESNLSFKLLDHGLKKEETVALDAILHNLNYMDLNALDPIVQRYKTKSENYVS
ncbi:MAG: hypothetical protein K2N65_04700 [Anaeroplasmataceae bacterium]|nr:hypothetical protein [Anaeroplasmataceae bacterium]